ncbi:MAG: hypothetical protein ACRCVL_07340 [Cetobacterium sp.]
MNYCRHVFKNHNIMYSTLTQILNFFYFSLFSVNIQTLRQEVKPTPVAGAAVTSTPSQIMAKRPGSSMSPTTNIKRPRLDTRSPDPASFTPLATSKPMNTMDVAGQQRECHTGKSLITSALNTLQESCFDALPTIAGRLLFGRVSEVPGLRDKEKSVISDFCENRVNEGLRFYLVCMKFKCLYLVSSCGLSFLLFN